MPGMTVGFMLDGYVDARRRGDIEGAEIFRKLAEFNLGQYGDVQMQYNETGYVSFWRYKRWLWKKKREHIGYYNSCTKVLVLPGAAEGRRKVEPSVPWPSPPAEGRCE